MIVVVAEGNSGVRGFLCRTLESRGHRVIPAMTGTEAWGGVQFNRPDILITELRLTGIDGMELVQRTRRQYPVTHIIVTAQDTRIEAVVDAYRAGVHNFVRKPYAVDEVAAIVDSHAVVVARDAVVRCGELVVDGLNHTAWVGNKELPVADDISFSILSLLIRNRERIFHRDDLIRTIWGTKKIPNPLELDNRIRALTDGIKKSGASHRYIYLIPDMAGYALTESPPLKGLRNVGVGRSKQESKNGETTKERGGRRTDKVSRQ